MDIIGEINLTEMIDKLRYTLVAADAIGCDEHLILKEIIRILQSYGYKVRVYE